MFLLKGNLMKNKFKVDKSKGLVFTYKHPWLTHKINFYRGLHSSASCVGEFAGREIYLSSPHCLTVGKEKAAYDTINEVFFKD